MSQISVISKLTGVETTTEGTQVTLSHSSIVELNVERASVSHFARNGNDLLVTLHSGEVITLKNFYVTDAQGVSQLVLQDSNGALWWIEDPTGAATYESIASTDVLLAASGATVVPPSGHGHWAALPQRAASRRRQAPAAVIVAAAIRPMRIRQRRTRLPALSSLQMAKPSPVPQNPAVPSR
jgi:hypothetical protein